MKLSSVEMIPGIVIDAADPKHIGRIKVNAPGVFQTSNPESLPWVYPLTCSSPAALYVPKINEQVWVLNNRANYSEFWYIPFPNIIETAKETINDYENAQVLAHNQTATGTITEIALSDTIGLKMACENSEINLTNEGDIQLTSSSDKELSLDTDEIRLGNINEDYQKAVLGNKLVNLLKKLEQDIRQIAIKAASNSFTSDLSESLYTAADNISSNITNILSKNIKIN